MAEGDGQAIAWLEEFASHIRGLHDTILMTSGGLSGEHTERLLSVCARPFHTAFGESLFHTPIDQAAALFHGIIAGHVFVDGNKRTAVSAAIYFLGTQEILETAPSPLVVRLLGELAVEVASTKMDADDVSLWFARILAVRS